MKVEYYQKLEQLVSDIRKDIENDTYKQFLLPKISYLEGYIEALKFIASKES